MKEAITTIATPLEGGFYAGRININGVEYALIVAPKAEGEHGDIEWNEDRDEVSGALSYCDGLANTNAMADAGSAVAKWAHGLRIGGFDDWYIPSQDELEVCYRNLKPGSEKNYLYARSGINVSAIPPTYPYTAQLPAQTSVDAFKSGGTEAFDEVAYWSSTQHGSDSACAWDQDFGNGSQGGWRKDDGLRARAVRRLKL